MKRITISTSVRATAGGLIGGWMFVLAPIIGALCWLWYLSALAARPLLGYQDIDYTGFAAVLCAAASVAWLASILLLLFGRQHTHEVSIIDDAPRAAARPEARSDATTARPENAGSY